MNRNNGRVKMNNISTEKLIIIQLIISIQENAEFMC